MDARVFVFDLCHDQYPVFVNAGKRVEGVASATFDFYYTDDGLGNPRADFAALFP